VSIEPIAPPRGRRPDPGKRDRIIEAASGLFGARDLSSVRMEEVAARAGVAKGTVYLYFHSKEDLYFSILATRLSVLLDALEQAFRDEEDPRVRLRKFLVHASMFLLKYPDFFRMMRKEESRPLGAFPGPEIEVEPLRARLRELLRCLLTRGMDAGRIRQMPVDLAAELVFGALEGMVRRCLEEGCTPQRHDQAPAALFDFVWRALQVEPGDPVALRPIVAGRTCVERLDGAVVVVTREEAPGEGLSAEIMRLGGVALAAPVLRTEGPSDPAPLRAAVGTVADYAWVLFASARGVEAFAEAWRDAGRPGIPPGTRLGAVGPATARAAMEQFGRCDYTASESRGSGLAYELLRRETLRDRRILVARAEDGRPDLVNILRGAGALVDEVIAYRTVPATIDPAPIREALGAGRVTAVTFASPSAAEAFIGQVGAGWLGGPEGHTLVVTIGPSTSEAVRALGIDPAGEADAPSLSELARAAARAARECAPPDPSTQGANP
jgi:uroporphyrinogen-III synthase/AcrR family transcriptional regulator